MSWPRRLPPSCPRKVASAGRWRRPKRLDKLTRQFERLERDQTILIETMALFVRYYLSVTTPIPEAHQDAARAKGAVASSSSSSNSAGTCNAAAAWCGTFARKFSRAQRSVR